MTIFEVQTKTHAHEMENQFLDVRPEKCWKVKRPEKNWNVVVGKEA